MSKSELGQSIEAVPINLVYVTNNLSEIGTSFGWAFSVIWLFRFWSITVLLLLHKVDISCKSRLYFFFPPLPLENSSSQSVSHSLQREHGTSESESLLLLNLLSDVEKPTVWLRTAIGCWVQNLVQHNASRVFLISRPLRWSRVCLYRDSNHCPPGLRKRSLEDADPEIDEWIVFFTPREGLS